MGLRDSSIQKCATFPKRNASLTTAFRKRLFLANNNSLRVRKDASNIVITRVVADATRARQAAGQKHKAFKLLTSMHNAIYDLFERGSSCCLRLLVVAPNIRLRSFSRLYGPNFIGKLYD